MTVPTRSDFFVEKADLGRIAWAQALRQENLCPGSIEVKVLRFAFTSNNVTYARYGEEIAYWRYFPALAASYGRIPVWGIGEVTRSAHDQIVKGERVYGYLPMSSHVVLQPVTAGSARFHDATAHRLDLPKTYNEYRRLDHDPSYDPALADFHLVLRPLFSLSFFLAEFLKDERLFGAERVVVTSASSKTALGLAHLLRAVPGLEVIGLTSARNADFVRRQSCYDAVVDYDAVADLPCDNPVVVVDIAGSNAVLRTLHHHLGETIRYSSRVGATHVAGSDPGGDLPGPKPEFFFTPTHILKRRQAWGEAELSRRLTADWAAFLEGVPTWLRIEHCSGREAVERVYREVVAGAVPPDRADILTIE